MGAESARCSSTADVLVDDALNLAKSFVDSGLAMTGSSEAAPMLPDQYDGGLRFDRIVRPVPGRQEEGEGVGNTVPSGL